MSMVKTSKDSKELVLYKKTLIKKIKEQLGSYKMDISDMEILTNRIKELLSKNKMEIVDAAMKTLPILALNNQIARVSDILDSKSNMESKILSTLLSSNAMLNSKHLDEMLDMIKKSKKDESTLLATITSCFSAVINSPDFRAVVSSFLEVKNVGQVNQTLDFLSRHGEKIENPDYVTNSDTIKLLLLSKNQSQAYYRSEMATYLTKKGLMLNEIHNFMSLIQSENSFNQYSSLMVIFLNLDETSRTILINKINEVKEPYKIDYVLQYVSNYERYDDGEKLKLLAEFIRDISSAKDEEAAKAKYRSAIKSMYEIPDDVDTLKYPWGELKIVSYRFDEKIISTTTTLNGEYLLPGSVLWQRTEEDTNPKIKKYH